MNLVKRGTTKKKSRWFVGFAAVIPGALIVGTTYAAETIRIATWNIENLVGFGAAYGSGELWKRAVTPVSKILS